MRDYYAEHSVGRVPGSRSLLKGGLEVLEEWSESAPQASRNLVYRALFAVADGSLYQSFQTMSHRARPGELAIYLRNDLVLTISWQDGNFFDIAYLGLPSGAPGIGRGSR